MIQQRALVLSRFYYAAVCSSCGELGEEADSIQNAHQLALNAGWIFRTIWSGGDMTYVYTCPECQGMEGCIEPSYDDTPEIDAAGQCFSDADPGL
jgi:hypothetical protein